MHSPKKPFEPRIADPLTAFDTLGITCQLPPFCRPPAPFCSQDKDFHNQAPLFISRYLSNKSRRPTNHACILALPAFINSLSETGHILINKSSDSSAVFCHRCRTAEGERGRRKITFITFLELTLSSCRALPSVARTFDGSLPAALNTILALEGKGME